MNQNLEENVFVEKQLFSEERDLRKFYQNIVLKIGRDCELYHDEEDAELMDSIVEDDDDIVHQR